MALVRFHLLFSSFSCRDPDPGTTVDKIIIDQESTGNFINDLCPGAYKNLTKVDFKTMDNLRFKPLGIYGSKTEIIRFFRELNAIDRNTYAPKSLIYKDD